ncbi:MAG: Putative DNA-binding protein [uncultured Paraburkholderia sp.]|nr:MAG: Putative DNA-binding protein [uncultured Paraburkholderia sp.]CAH2931489.1 MAG: Putative DNA-binding protein [uncultured Paraburkholderia sp.]
MEYEFTLKYRLVAEDCDLEAIVERLGEAGPDFVGLTDVADVAGVSRQNMRKLMLIRAIDFPAPVHEGSASVWHLSDVLDWLNARGGYDIGANISEVARSAKQVNLAKEVRELEPGFNRQLECLVA